MLTRSQLKNWILSIKNDPSSVNQKLLENFGSSTGVFNVIDMPNLGGYISVASAVEGGISIDSIAEHFETFYSCKK